MAYVYCQFLLSSYVYSYYSKGTTDTHKLFNALHTKTILSIVGVSPNDTGLTKLIGKVLIRIEYLCAL